MAEQLALFETPTNLPATIEQSNAMMKEFFSYGPSMEEMAEIGKYMQSDDFKDKVELTPEHAFADGIYARSLKIKAGDLVAGKKHGKGHFTFLMQGKATIVTDYGINEIEAPLYWKDEAGVQRYVYAQSDCVFVTTHASDSQDLDELENELINKEESL